MRKFPIYNLMQEITMQLMALLLIIGYIAYDQLNVLGVLGYVIIGFTAVGIIFSFVRQLKNMTVAKIIFQTKHKKFEVVKSNWGLIILSNILLIGLSILHFYIWMQQGKELLPLYKEYGFGALLGVGMFVLNIRDFSVITTDKGIAFGSKFDLKLLLWKDIKSVQQTEKHLVIIPKNTIGFKSIKVPNKAVSRDLESLMSLENVLRNTSYVGQ